MRLDKTKAEQRKTGNCDRGREGFSACLLCNVWQCSRVFVVVFYTDNHVLTTVTLNTNTHTHNNFTGLEIRENATQSTYIQNCMVR